jgi:hypothetical protein
MVLRRFRVRVDGVSVSWFAPGHSGNEILALGAELFTAETQRKI